MHITEDQAAALARLAPTEVGPVTESALTELESPAEGPARPPDRTLAVLAVLLAAARAPPADSALLAASLQAASVPPDVLERLLSAAAESRPRVRRALLAGRPAPQQLSGLSWRLATVVGSRALPTQLRPELLLRLQLTQQPHQLSLLVEPVDLRHITAELERALSRRPAGHRLGPSAPAPPH
ncbi:hypothetical protein FJT64_027842 [Amphibalanus amphitrite]|uniref:COMM domain-containing protein n=1 Tax=Amphibalanus amphitrite TaxID=1232801 RepID=A0A6A4W6N3_AMPAM|nr:hypothetical protein FJT64_027842 [Amphibalanus amphitrite]